MNLHILQKQVTFEPWKFFEGRAFADVDFRASKRRNHIVTRNCKSKRNLLINGAFHRRIKIPYAPQGRLKINLLSYQHPILHLKMWNWVFILHLSQKNHIWIHTQSKDRKFICSLRSSDRMFAVGFLQYFISQWTPCHRSG